jgi:hypothetical protein
MKIFIGILVLALVASGCVQTQRSPYVPKALRVNAPIFETRAVRMADSTIRLLFITSPKIRTPDPNIRWVEAAVGPSESMLSDTITFSVTSSGAPGAVNTVQLVGDANWDTPAAKQATQVVADISVVTASSHLIFRETLSVGSAVPMELTAFSVAVNDTTLDIGMMAKRVFLPQGEYLSSSENLRVIIVDNGGKVVWRSDATQKFLAAITKVEPQTINQIHRYSTEWNGRDLSGNTVPSGEYSVKLEIPCRPAPYTSQSTITWPPR